MRIYPNEITLRLSVITLLEMYNKGIFRNGRREDVYDQRFINLLLIELVGLEDMETGKIIDSVTKKCMFSKLFPYTKKYFVANE